MSCIFELQWCYRAVSSITVSEREEKGLVREEERASQGLTLPIGSPWGALYGLAPRGQGDKGTRGAHIVLYTVNDMTNGV